MMNNLLSKHATELAKEIGDTKAPTINHYTEHIHCPYIKTSQMPVLAILEVKNMLLLITLVSQVKKQGQRKELTSSNSHSDLEQESGFKSKSLESQVRVFSTRPLEPAISSDILGLLLCSQSCNLQSSAK